VEFSGEAGYLNGERGRASAGDYWNSNSGAVGPASVSRFHKLVIVALGITWILDGLNVTLVGAISGVLPNPHTFGFTPAQIGILASWYIVGAAAGSHSTILILNRRIFTDGPSQSLAEGRVHHNSRSKCPQ